MNGKLARYGWGFIVGMVLSLIIGMHWVTDILGGIIGALGMLAVAYGAWGLTKTELATDTVAKVGAWLAFLGTLVMAFGALTIMLQSIPVYAGYAWMLGLLLMSIIALIKGKMEMGLLVLVALVLIALPALKLVTLTDTVSMIMGLVALLLLGVSLMRNE